MIPFIMKFKNKQNRLNVKEIKKWLWGGIVIRKGTRTFWGATNILQLDTAGGYVCVYVDTWKVIELFT